MRSYLKAGALLAGLLALTCFTGLLTGCVQGSTAAGQQTLANLTVIANTAKADLASTIAVANAMTPPDTDGVQCATATQTVQGELSAVLAAVPNGSTVGVFTAAELASALAPGSAQFNQVVKTIETGCIAKLHDVNQAGAATAGVPAAIAAALAIAAAPAGA